MAATAAIAEKSPARFESVGDLLRRLGGVSPGRVRLHPALGTATEKDVEEIHDREKRLYELVEGVLVEKVLGFEESELAIYLGMYLIEFLRRHDLGKIVGEAGAMRLFPGLVRIPDVSFISWERYPKGKKKPIPDLVPDLAVEVLSKGNTKKETAIKLGDCFRAGVRLVWYVEPKSRTVRVYTAADRSTLLKESDTLDGGDVLPGFSLSIRDWFAEAGRDSPTR